jgi:polar amino acid transport system substrate-binding protein
MRRIGWLGCCAAVAFAAAEPAAARDLQQVLNGGTLRVGVALYAPWAARGPEGELVGFEIDVARQLAADMGVEAVLLVYDFERLIPALESGEIDLIAAGLTITPERALHVNFSQPYAETGVALATNLPRTAAVERLEDLDSDAYSVAAVEGSVAVELGRRLLPRAELRLFDSVEAASAALLAGEVDAYLEDEPIPTFLALENPDAIDVPMSRPLLASRAAFAVNKGDPDFLAFLNAWITARDADTWLPTTIGYWFESLQWRSRVEDGADR